MQAPSLKRYEPSYLKTRIIRLTNKLKRTANFPAFQTTIEGLRSFYSEIEISPERIVNVILADIGLCVQVLRAANSAFFNPLSFPMNTVSRAAVLLGFDNLKQIASSSPILEEKFLEDEDFLREYALALVSAHLAFKAAEKKKLVPEEAYLAALFRPLARLMLLMKAPILYHELLNLSQTRRKELFLLLGKRLAKHWNLPSPILDGLEGQEYEVRKQKLPFYPLCERLALSLLEEGVLHGWQHLFDSPEGILQAFEELKKKLLFLPVRLREALSDWINVDDGAFESESLPQEGVLYLPRETLRLAQKMLSAMAKETRARGRLFYLEEERLESPEEPLSPEAEKFLLELLRRERSYLAPEKTHLYLPLRFGEVPAILLSLKRKEPFSSEELSNLEFLRRILETFLNRF